MEGLHWLLVLTCISISTVALHTAIESAHSLKVIGKNSQTVAACAGILDELFGDDGSGLGQIAGETLANWRLEKRKELITAMILAFGLSLMVNILLFIFLQHQGRKQTRQKQHRAFYGHSTSMDNF